MQIIDFHTHIYPNAIAHKAAQSIRDFYHIGDVQLDGTVEKLLECGDGAGISRFVVLPVGLKPDHVAHINDFIVSEVAKEPRFTGFGTVHAAMENLTEETERVLSMGLKGIKLHPDSQGFAVDDERLFPAYEALRGKGTLMVHAGDVRYDYSHPRRIRRVLELFPGLQVIAAHFGGYSMYDTAYETLKGMDCFFDVSSSLMFLEPGMAEHYIRGYGAERFVFGTDFPLWDPRIEIKKFMELKLTPAEMEQIAYKTALHILNED